MKKLCYIATIPAVVQSFLHVHIQSAKTKYDVTVVCNSIDKHFLSNLGVRIIYLPIERKPSLLRDIVSFWRLYKLFHHERFDIIHSIMPKSGFLAMSSGWLAGIPTRIHTFTGQVWVTRQGIRRALLKWFDKRIAGFATFILTDSPSQRDFLVNQGILSDGKATVLGCGSSCGVDSSRFRPDMTTRNRLRHELGIAQNAMVILFVGRLNSDKGVLDLAASFNEIARCHSDVSLLMVGTEEDISFQNIREICYLHVDRFHYVKFTSEPQCYMALADIFCLPSYREGFPMTIIEAAACGIPSVASRIYGITDAVVDGTTGLLFPPRDVLSLTRHLLKLIDDDDLRSQLGQAARERVLQNFGSLQIAAGMMQLYDTLSAS